MPSAELPFSVYIQGKEFEQQKLLLPSPSGEEKNPTQHHGNLKALLENWPMGGLESDTFM